MGFAERNSSAGKMSSISFPDAIKRGASDSATQFTIQITDANGSPNDPDSATLYVRVTNAAGTAQDSLIYTNSALNSAATNSTNGTYSNSGSAYWKSVSTSSGAATLYHKTGTASNLEGIYHLEYAWFENGEAINGSQMFRIIDLADMDTVNTNVGSDSDSSSASGSVHAKIKDVKTAVAALNDASTSANADAVWDEATSGHSNAGSAGKALTDILADTAELQGDWANGGRLDVILDAVLVDTATLGAPTGASHAADVAAVKAVVDSILTDTGTTLDDLIDTEVAAILADTAELQGDWANGGRLDLLIDAIKAVTDALPDSGALSSIATAAALATVDGNVDDVEAAVGALGDSASADYATNKTAMGMIRKLGADVATVDGVADAILVDTGTTIPATLGSPAGASVSADVAAVKAVVDSILTDTGTTLDDLIDTEVAAILADTNELQGDWTNGGRLDTIVDSILADTATLGAPAGASHAADVAAVKAVVDSILTDTGTTLDDLIDTEVAAILADTNELQGDWTNGGRLDLLLDGVKSVTDSLPNSGALTDLATASAVSTLQTAVTAIQNNTRFVATVPQKINRPGSGSEAVAVGCYLYDTSGNMEDPDSNGLYVKISQMDGSAVASRYYSNSGLSSAISAEGSGTFSGYYAMTRVAAGKYMFFYKNDTGHTEENLAVEFGWEEGSAARLQARSMQVSDAADLDDIVADTNELQGDWTNGGRLDTILDSVLADTAELQGDWANGGRLDVIVDGILADTATLGAPAGASHAADIAAVKTVVDSILVDTGTTLDDFIDTEAAAILADTNELQGDWTNGGRLDVILDSVLADTATLGAPAGASHAADVAAVKAVVDSILTDTGTTLDDLIDTEVAAILADTNELQGDWTNGGRLDTIVDSILADTATLGAPAGASHAADIAAVKTVVDSILTDTGTTLDDLIDTEVAAILADTNELQGDWANGGRLDVILDAAATASALTTVDNEVGAIQTDLGDFSAGSNLQSLKAVVGSKLDDQNVTLDTLLMLGNMSMYKVASNSHSGSGGTFTLTTLGSGYHGASPSNDDYVGGSFCVLAGTSVGRVILAVDYNGSNGQITYGGSSLADNDVIAYFPPSGYVGKSDDSAASSSSDAGKSLFARLRYMADQMDANKGTQRGTFKKYLRRSTAGTLGNDPTDTAESAASTTTSAAFAILDVQTISFDEGSDATIEDIFAVFKWKHQGTDGGSGGGVTTQWYMSGGASAPSAGAAISGVGDAVAVSDAIAGTTTASTNSVSGLVNQNALNTFSNGKIHVMLCGKAGSAGDTCTGWIFHSSSAEVTYEV